MFNPHCLFSERLLNALVLAEKRYFVRQSFPRAAGPGEQGIKGHFLISHYGDFVEAMQHFEALAGDRFRCLYFWNNRVDRIKLQKAAEQPAGYKIYAAVVMPGWEERAAMQLREKVKLFADHHFKLRPGGPDPVRFSLYPHFGEVFLKIRFRKQEIKISLAEVENFHPHVL